MSVDNEQLPGERRASSLVLKEGRCGQMDGGGWGGGEAGDKGRIMVPRDGTPAPGAQRLCTAIFLFRLFIDPLKKLPITCVNGQRRSLRLYIKYTCIVILFIGFPSFLFKRHLSGNLGTRICTSELYQQRNASLDEPPNYSEQEKQGKREGPPQGHGLS